MTTGLDGIEGYSVDDHDRSLYVRELVDVQLTDETARLSSALSVKLTVSTPSLSRSVADGADEGSNNAMCGGTGS